MTSVNEGTWLNQKLLGNFPKKWNVLSIGGAMLVCFKIVAVNRCQLLKLRIINSDQDVPHWHTFSQPKNWTCLQLLSNLTSMCCLSWPPGGVVSQCDRSICAWSSVLVSRTLSSIPSDICWIWTDFCQAYASLPMLTICLQVWCPDFPGRSQDVTHVRCLALRSWSMLLLSFCSRSLGRNKDKMILSSWLHGPSMHAGSSLLVAFDHLFCIDVQVGKSLGACITVSTILSSFSTGFQFWLHICKGEGWWFWDGALQAVPWSCIHLEKLGQGLGCSPYPPATPGTMQCMFVLPQLVVDLCNLNMTHWIMK